MTVVVLEDAAEDLESGAQFYESCAFGRKIVRKTLVMTKFSDDLIHQC